MDWLTAEWALQTACAAALSAAVVSLVLMPAVKWLRRMLDPHTAGGLGDVIAPDGQLTHEWLAEREPPQTKENSK